MCECWFSLVWSRSVTSSCICLVTVFVEFSLFFFFKQKTAYEMRISAWSSDVCSSDLYCSQISREISMATSADKIAAALRPIAPEGKLLAAEVPLIKDRKSVV